MMSETPLFRHRRESEELSGNYASVKTSTETTVNEDEVKKFQELARHWWDSSMFPCLRAMNSLRVPFIQDGILQMCSGHHKEKIKSLMGFNILDVGCGGGLLAEPLARLGAHVTGLDPSEESIKIAQFHSSQDPWLRDNLEYICGTVEDHSKGSKKYDAVVCSEVIEHVDNVPYFVKCCTDLVKDNGSVFFTTINRTTFSYIVNILLAERIFRYAPQGAHEWNKFIKPEDLKLMLQSHNFRTVSDYGMLFIYFIRKCFWFPYQGGLYALHAVKEVIPASTDDS